MSKMISGHSDVWLPYFSLLDYAVLSPFCCSPLSSSVCMLCAMLHGGRFINERHKHRVPECPLS